jgi:ribosomal protein L37AE/L43A
MKNDYPVYECPKCKSSIIAQVYNRLGQGLTECDFECYFCFVKLHMNEVSRDKVEITLVK